MTPIESTQNKKKKFKVDVKRDPENSRKVNEARRWNEKALYAVDN